MGKVRVGEASIRVRIEAPNEAIRALYAVATEGGTLMLDGVLAVVAEAIERMSVSVSKDDARQVVFARSDSLEVDMTFRVGDDGGLVTE